MIRGTNRNNPKKNHRQKDYAALLGMRDQIEAGQGVVPRSYIRRYGGATRQINDNGDYLLALLLRPEYSIIDAVKFVKGLTTAQRLYGTAEGDTAEAVKRVIWFCFEEEGYDFLMCSHSVANEQSKRVIEKCGLFQ